MRLIDSKQVQATRKNAQQSPRLRSNYNFHDGPNDRLHRMINAIEPGSYIRPHKHESPDKWEIFMLLEGALLLVEFNPDGTLFQHALLSMENGRYGAEVPPGTYHMLIALDQGAVIYEVKEGPWNPATDKDFAEWAPAEDDPAAKTYLNELLEKLNGHD